MKHNYFSIIYKTLFILFFSFVLFLVSCSDSSPDISSLHRTLIYEFNSEEEKAVIRLSLFCTSSQDIRRSKALKVTHSKSNLVWKVDNLQVYEDDKKNYFGYSSLVVPENFDFPEGTFEATYYDVADREISENFNVTLLKSMKETGENFVTANDVRIKKVGTECTQKKIIIFDEIGKEIFFGLYSTLIDSDDKILKLFPDAVTKRIYLCNQNNSVGILLPEEQINK